MPPAPPVVAVLRLDGVIAARGGLRGKGLSIAGLAEPIERAFRLKDLAAVALVINSPGGSPVQSALIERRIRQLALEKNVPVLAFAEDVAASGGYWLALAADEIYAQEASIMGSIGVVSAGFGFTDLIRRFGIERRVHTAGTSKAMLDPFRAEEPGDVERLKALQLDIHDGFKDLVRARRGARLREDDEIFTGAVFTGRQALARGLIDGIGDLRQVLRERFGTRVRLRPVGERPRRRFGLRFPGLASRLDPIDLLTDGLNALEERAIWARFGL
ncbi:peptidase S49 [Aliidongia dinghuensis]|uniref:Peptidase S49 n=1 Tax=Aliidongia dinghuensis TaxID=1867774 RepID=A0A8J2YWW3_9PROT|nr:S49 family peptidase [Aliidongia dinghuensis]GGF26454.1 peptidase S49 [Aliidongia dinghuensis]